MSRSSTLHRRPPARAAAIPFALALVLTGCTLNQSPVAELFDRITPPSPREVASEAFDVDPDVRRRSVAQLSAAPFGGEEPYLRLYRLLVTDPDDTVRAACVKALGAHGEAQDTERIVVRLTDSSAIVRWEAAQALQKIHHPAAVDPLMRTLISDPDADVKQAAAIALGQYPRPAVFNALVQALEDPQFSVAAAARTSLTTLTGQDFGTDINRWLTYAEENSETVFARQTQYTWTPFDKPPTLLQRLQFWKPREKPVPQVPVGYYQDGAEQGEQSSGS